MPCTPHCAQAFVQLLIIGLSNGAVLALSAIGITVVFGTVRTLNLAHGDVFALASVLVTTLLRLMGANQSWPLPMLVGALGLAFIAAVTFGAGLNLAIERLAFRPFRGRSRLAPLIATLGISFILYQIALIWRTTSWVRGVHHGDGGPLNQVPTDGIPDLLADINLVQTLGLPFDVRLKAGDVVVLVVAIIAAVAVHQFLSRTATGRAIRACSQHTQLAQLCGVNPEAAISRAFAFGGALAGAAAFVFALYYARPFGQHGAQSGLLAFTVAILGGIGNPVGALVSGLLLGVFSAFSDYFLAAQWTPVLLQLLLIGLLVARPGGLIVGDDAPTLATSDALTTAVLSQRPLRLQTWGVGVFVLALPIVFGIQWQLLYTSLGLFVILALGLNLLLGLAGILDLSYAASYGVGAYAAALLTQQWGWLRGYVPQPLDFTLVLLISLLVAGLFGTLKGLLALRLRNDYLAVVTVALGFLTRQMIMNLKEVTSGAQGMAALPPPHLLFTSITHPLAQYGLVLVLVLLVIGFSQRLIHSRFGRAWRAGSEDETAATASGLDAMRYKLLALALSSGIAGMAGALYASLFANVSVEMFDFHLSAMTLGMVILGGAGSVPGVIGGSLLLAGYGRVIIPRLAELLAYLQPGELPLVIAPDIRGLNYLTFGLAIYLTVLLRARRQTNG